jgi:bisphosphoglycerate-independent phosphoglycerate mutase (AlkP superfamily)
MIRLAGLVTGKKKVHEAEYMEFDYKYYKGQVTAAIEAVEAVEEELMREIQGRAEDPTFMNQTAAQQAENQARRYIMGSQKQLEGLAKMLDRLESRGEL